jgi:hypothetical protein
MELFDDFVMLAGLVLLPAAATLCGGFVLGWLDRYEPAPAETPDGIVAALAAVPFAALSAAMVLAPVVVAVWAVIAEEEAIAYLATIGFALGAIALTALAAAETPGGKPRWPAMPGVVLSSAVGFFVALTSYLGGSVVRALDVRVNDGWRVVVPIGVAVLIGGLALAAYRRRLAVAESAVPEVDDALTAQNE